MARMVGDALGFLKAVADVVGVRQLPAERHQEAGDEKLQDANEGKKRRRMGRLRGRWASPLYRRQLLVSAKPRSVQRSSRSARRYRLRCVAGLQPMR